MVPIKNYKKKSALLALASGELFWGTSIGNSNCVVGEMVFNTSMTGYQEILTDPSYAKQLVVFTCPHIGNVGVNQQDAESSGIWPSGLILRDKLCPPSNYRSEESLEDYCKKNQLLCITGIDTRQLTHILREKGLQKACLVAGDSIDPNYAIKMAQSSREDNLKDLVSFVSTPKVYQWEQETSVLPNISKQCIEEDFDKQCQVIVYDFGVKRSILRKLVDMGCKVMVVPYNTSIEEVLAYKPHGIVFSNGPGDPRKYLQIVQTILKFLKKNIPLLGICLGHQLLALAAGAEIVKMKFGHHGSNHPVQCLKTKQVFITSQNHGFTVNAANLPKSLRVTHRSLFDDSVQGVEYVNKPVIGFQGHPEGGPGPADISGLFNRFMAMMFQFKSNQTSFFSSALEF